MKGLALSEINIYVKIHLYLIHITTSQRKLHKDNRVSKSFFFFTNEISVDLKILFTLNI